MSNPPPADRASNPGPARPHQLQLGAQPEAPPHGSERPPGPGRREGGGKGALGGQSGWISAGRSGLAAIRCQDLSVLVEDEMRSH